MKCLVKRGLSVLIVFGIIVSSFFITPVTGGAVSHAKKKADNDTFRDVFLGDGQTVSEADYEGGCFDIGDHGLLSFNKSKKKDWDEVYFPSNESKTMGEDIFKNETINYEVADPSIIEIDASTHTYRAAAGGSTTVTMTMEYEVPKDPAATGEAVGLTTKTRTATMLFIVGNDTTGVTLDRYQATIYVTSDYVDGKAEFQMYNCPNLTYHNLGVSTAGNKIDVSLSLDMNKPFFTLVCNSPGKDTVMVKLNNQVFQIKLTVIRLDPNRTSKVLELGQSFTLKLKNWPKKTDWKSTDPKVATVTADGVVKAKKVGNTIIYMDIQGNRIGCIVSVVKKGIAKVVKRAMWIGDNWKYSQPLRMRSGYYDCSSLVWKAYRLSGRYVCGATGYAPVAADIGHWGVRIGRYKGKFREKKIGKLYYLPGDCLLKVRMRSDRYKGIGHIEMITGYSLHGFIGTKPVLYLTWGAREEGYGASRADDFVIRPYN
ncbi:MAG: Ig-like domain-containing protein [Eubacterium sp.]|nr:Ig-like domain-containing protein [Eubacterium sp.]